MGSSPTLLRRARLLLLLFSSVVVSSSAAVVIFNVKDYGAVPDAKKDSAQAFMHAWKDACGAAEGEPRVLVPEGTFMVSPVVFQGPCKSPAVVFQVAGTVVASEDLSEFSDDAWIEFDHVDGLLLTGGGKFDGRGSSAWQYNDCKHSSSCTLLPTSIKLSSVTNTTVRSITSLNSKSFHLVVHGSRDVNLHSLTITAPADSPNTDGIHIGKSSNVNVGRSAIGTGDDCISIGPGSVGVTITSVRCGPGHGISVGSLGKYEDEEDVAGVRVRNCTFQGTTNGVRIKTWPNSQPSAASDMIFENIVMDNVANPIIINQQYCASSSCSNQSPSRVKISDVKFKNIRGVSLSKVAVNLLCSNLVPCKGVELGDIHLTYGSGGGGGDGGDDGGATASCTNVDGLSLGSVIPPACL
ncbi:unnamed protein product [Spirodela intermedia]|uniref:Exopolygalacturonase n=1 Tax=Spirodela intermedia TaxID=51605 RepID=A0A7I8KNC4_SPIIN|nr:unnamed protein product [Spirodela intermedia]